ncbi:hypothetical protein [Bordetella petrii]|uniref:hypothetical protein n=1 Tax=Bordetella petrii TaxID=94624 RepID=UPI001A967E1A|nr:hypothetical protein [Bordetella petrii]MBO1114262.1 hypothetical protein [Bordetella petrii]
MTDQRLANKFAGLDDAHTRFVLMHRTLGLPVLHHPRPLGIIRTKARAKWMQSEIDELRRAVDIVDQVDALMDILCHVMGALVEMGVRPGVPMTLVYESNLAKLWPDGVARLDVDGKLLKPPNWEGPEKAIQRWLSELGLKTAVDEGNP